MEQYKKIAVGIIGCGFVGDTQNDWLEHLHELNVHFRGVEEHI